MEFLREIRVVHKELELGFMLKTAIILLSRTVEYGVLEGMEFLYIAQVQIQVILVRDMLLIGSMQLTMVLMESGFMQV